METLLACLTPPGKAAIATLAVRGADAWAVTRQLFQPRKTPLPAEPDVGRYFFGRLGGDEVILAVKQAEPIPSLEVHCHGGVEVVGMIQELYQQHGIRIVPWQKLVDDSLLDLLVRAPTTRTAAILLDQWQGAWSRCVEEILAASPASAAQKLQRLSNLIPLGQHLALPWRIVIAGAPNVGKSSLMNALAGYTRSIVSPMPGTTRDVVTTAIAIDGWPIELCDTAGIRAAPSSLERQGIKRAQDALREADLRLWLLDAAAQPVFPDESAGWNLLINKIDLPAAWDLQHAGPVLRISATTHAGLAELCERISARLVPAPPGPGQGVPVLPEQVAWIHAHLAKDSPLSPPGERGRG